MNGRSFFLSVLIAGIVTGVLGNLPLLNLVNCLLCIFAWLGGVLAVVLYRRFQAGGPPATVGQGAALGAVTGLVGAVVGVLVFAISSPLSMRMFGGLARILQLEGDFFQITRPTLWEIATTAIVFLIIDAILYPLFGAIAGAITASLAREGKPIAA